MSEAPEYRICSNAPFALDCTLDKTLTVAAWVESSTARAEAMQPLVSQWWPRAAFAAFDAYDAGHTDGLVTQGYFGAVCDGRYAYFCPIRDQQERTSVHGRVLRLDTQADFKNPDAWAAYDASYTDGLHTAGFYGGAFDGRYVYFNPRDDGTIHHSRLLRYDTQADFKDPDAWAAYDAQFPHSGQGLAFDGHYLYFCPGYTRSSIGGLDDEHSGRILRYDTRAPLKDPTSYTVFNAQQLHPEAACFDGAVFDGRHIYFAPLDSGHVLRYAVTGDFADPQSWDLYDARPLGMQMNVGAVFDGRHIYFCAYGNSQMLRYDTAAPFDDPQSWDTYVPGRTAALTAASSTDATCTTCPSPAPPHPARASSTALGCATTRPRRLTTQPLGTPTTPAIPTACTRPRTTPAHSTDAISTPLLGAATATTATPTAASCATTPSEQTVRSPCATTTWATTAGSARPCPALASSSTPPAARSALPLTKPSRPASITSPGCTTARASSSTSTARSRPRVQLVAVRCNRRPSP